MQANLNAQLNGADELTLEANIPVVREMIQTVIDAEAPIYEQLLTRRILQSCGVSRAGARVQNYLVGIYASMRLMTTFDSGGKLYWRQDQTPSEYRCIRAGGDERREIEQIPDCELENAIVEVLTLEVGLPRDDLIRVSSKLLGFSRLGANLTGRIGDAISRLAGRGKIEVDEHGGCAIADEDL